LRKGEKEGKGTKLKKKNAGKKNNISCRRAGHEVRKTACVTHIIYFSLASHTHTHTHTNKHTHTHTYKMIL